MGTFGPVFGWIWPVRTCFAPFWSQLAWVLTLCWGTIGVPSGVNMAPKNRFKMTFSKVVPDPLGEANWTFWAILGPLWPVWTPFQPFWPVLAQFPPAMGPRWGPTWAQNWSKWILWNRDLEPLGGFLGHFGPVLTILYAYTGYLIPDTGFQVPKAGEGGCTPLPPPPYSSPWN